ncbi:MAG: PGPGW domain-containing protein [Nocardioides sp.]
MTDAAPTPRAQQLLDRLDAWKRRGRLRAILVKLAVTVTGPLVILTGVAMTVLPGPGVVVMGLGLTLLALEYSWARTLLVRTGRLLDRVRRAALPRDGSPGRKLVGVAAAGAFVALTTVLTAAVTAYAGTQAFL